MVKQYKYVRIYIDDYNKIISQKKIPLEKQITKLTGKKTNLSTPKLFSIASKCNWDVKKMFENPNLKIQPVFHPKKIKWTCPK